jgi:hypothetical protein
MRVVRSMFVGAALLSVFLPRATRAQSISLDRLAGVRLPVGVDTMFSHFQPKGGAVRLRKSYYVRTVTSGPARWELRAAWHDSAGTLDATQITRGPARSVLVNEMRVLAQHDSASLLIAAGHGSAWVVPDHGASHLVSSDSVAERSAGEILEMTLAASHPAIGSYVVSNLGQLFSEQPLSVSVDTLRVTGSADVRIGSAIRKTWVLTHSNGTMAWADQSNGRVVLRRGSAGPNAQWWHAVAGAQLPSSGAP